MGEMIQPWRTPDYTENLFSEVAIDDDTAFKLVVKHLHQ